MTSPLSGIAVEKRRHLAATLGLFAMLFIAVGAVAATGATTAMLKLFVVVSLLIAVLLALLAWGVVHSVHLDLAEQRLDHAIEATVRARGGQLCDCGHEHDPTEMHLVGDEPGSGHICARDGSGHDCAHTCETCVFAAMRPSPTPRREKVPSAAQPRRRPSPTPR